MKTITALGVVAALTSSLAQAAPVTTPVAGHYSLNTALTLYSASGYPPVVNLSSNRGQLLSASWDVGLDTGNALTLLAADVRFMLDGDTTARVASVLNGLTRIGNTNQYELSVKTLAGDKVNLDFLAGTNPSLVTAAQNRFAYTSVNDRLVPSMIDVIGLDFVPTPVPEPSALTLVAVALACLRLSVGRRSRSAA